MSSDSVIELPPPTAQSEDQSDEQTSEASPPAITIRIAEDVYNEPEVKEDVELNPDHLETVFMSHHQRVREMEERAALDEDSTSEEEEPSMQSTVPMRRPTIPSYVDKEFDKNSLDNLRTYFADPTFRGRTFDKMGFMAKAVQPIEEELVEQEAESPTHRGALAEDSEKTGGFGTWDGVYVSCMLNIFGVIMFLRLGWVIGEAGVGLGILIVCMASVVTLLTTLSMSAICTNGEVKAGGAYYLISRSLGPSVGASIGVLFSIGMCVAVAMYVIGFCEPLQTQLSDAGFSPTGDVLNDIRIYGLVICCILLIMALIGVGWVIKMQIGLLVLLWVAILSFMVGCFLVSGEVTMDLAANASTAGLDGIGGFESGVLSENMGPDFLRSEGVDYDFFSVFAVFFPAVTGIMAGANISGDLKNPSQNIPKGTLYAIFHSTIVYCLLAFLIGAVSERAVCPDSGCDLDSLKPEDHYGLVFDTLVMVRVSVWGPLVLAGIYAATFSSALASLVGAPRILMSVARDRILPILNPFGKVNSSGDPIRGYFLSFGVACLCVLIGQLNMIAPLITMFFMMTYALINASCFMLELSKSPGWRPGFKYFNHWTALAGCLLCLVCMILIDYLWASIAGAIAIFIWKYVDYTKPEVSWGVASEGRAYVKAMKALFHLRDKHVHVKNFRPAYLVLSGDPKSRFHLIQFSNSLRFGYGITILGNVMFGEFKDFYDRVRAMKNNFYFIDKPTKTKCLLETVVSPSLREGGLTLMQMAGVGRLRPNTVVLGFKGNCDNKERRDHTKQYVNLLRDVLRFRLGVMVCRNLERLNWEVPKEGTVDVWWLVDDGGLTVLVPYILSRAKAFRHSKFRLFIITEQLDTMVSDYLIISNLLKKFRIDWGEPECVQTLNPITGKMAPLVETVEAFNEFAAVRGVPPVEEHHRPRRVKRWLRVGELLRQHSAKANMVFVTLPYPRSTNAPHYMTMLDYMSKDLPPTVFIRGCGNNVLTFYSE